MSREFMDEPENALVSTPPPEVCRSLRTKTAYGRLVGQAAPWHAGASNTAVFWCLNTMATVGPDGSPTHARECLAGRGCYSARD